MARDGVQYDQVVEICERLSERGTKPNQRNVRSELGTGSASTILRHVNQWKEMQSGLNNHEVDLPEALISIMKKSILEAVTSATNSLKEVISDAKEQIDEDIKILEEHERTIDQLDIKIRENENRYEVKVLELEKSLAAAIRQAEGMENRNIALTEKLESAIVAQEVARTESAKAQLQVERADKAAEKAEKQIEVMAQEASALKLHLAEAEKAAATAIAVSAEQNKTIDRLDSEMTGERKRSELLQARFESLQGKYDVAAKSASAADEQAKSLDRLTTELKTAQKRYDALQDKYEALTKSESSALTKLEVMTSKKDK